MNILHESLPRQLLTNLEICMAFLVFSTTVVVVDIKILSTF